MFVWALFPKAVFIYEKTKHLNVFCSLATRICADAAREMLILHFINLYVLFNVENMVMLGSIFYRDIKVPVFTVWKEEMEASAGEEYFYVNSQNNKICLRITAFQQQ